MSERLVFNSDLLTLAQKQAATEIQSSLDRAPLGTMVIVEGLTGVGKTMLLDAATPQIYASKGLVEHNIEKVRYPEKQLTQPTVISCTPVEAEAVDKALRDNQPVSRVILKGMTNEEASQYADQVRKPDSQLDKETIVDFSLGNPALIELLSDPRIELEQARNYVAEYIGRNLRELCKEPGDMKKLLNQYVFIMPPAEIIEKATQSLALRRKDIYEGTEVALSTIAMLNRREIPEPSIWVSNGTKKFLDRLLTGSYADFDDVLEIVVPSLSPEDMELFRESFNLKEDNNGNELISARRAKAFNREFLLARKVLMSCYPEGLNTRNPAIGLSHEPEEDKKLQYGYEILKTLRQARSNIPKELIADISTPFVYIYLSNHSNELDLLAAKGHVVLSWLEGRRIGYYLQNRKNYMYDPATQDFRETKVDLRKLIPSIKRL